MQYITSISLDLSGRSPDQRVYAKQGDKDTRIIKAQILSDGTPAELGSDVQTMFVCRKSDGTQAAYPVPASGNTISVTLSAQCLSAAGECRCELIFSKGETLLSTAVFQLVVEPAAYDAAAMESSDEYIEMLKATNSALQAAAAALSAAGEAGAASELAETAASKADTAAGQALDAVLQAEQAAKDAETVIASADVRFANAITGSGTGASVSCPQIWTGAPLVSAEIQGHTVEQGEGEKGPYNPYRFVGVVPTKITLAGTEQSEEAALPEIAPLHSLPTGIHDTYDPATGIETRRAGMQVITGSESGIWLSSSDRICIKKPANAPKWSGETQRDENTAHGINASISDYTYLYVSFLREEGDTDTQVKDKAIAYLKAQYEAGTPVTVTYPLKEPEITQHDPIAMRPPQSPATVSADQGELSVTYVKDTNQVIAELAGLIQKARSQPEN